MSHSDDQEDLIADILFALDDVRFVVRVDPSLAFDDDAGVALTAVVVEAPDPEAAADGILDLADELDWSVSVEMHGGDRLVSIGRVA